MDSDHFIDLVELGRQLGHDCYRLTRWPAHKEWPLSVREGFAAAAASQVIRTPQDDRFGRKWLQLRLGALQRKRSVAADVTVDLLRSLDTEHCPITRQRLTHCTGTDSDASVDRLNNDGAYTAANLAFISTGANRAKGTRSFAEVLHLAQLGRSSDGLAPQEWLRLAVLMLGPCFAKQPLQAPVLPLCAPLPATTLRTAVQQLQRLLTLSAGVAAERNRLLRQLRPMCGSERSQMRLGLLADAVHTGLKELPNGSPCWDVWLRPGLMAMLHAWLDSLDPPSRAKLAWTAGQIAGGHPVNSSTLRPWRLAERGYHAAHAG